MGPVSFAAGAALLLLGGVALAETGDALVVTGDGVNVRAGPSADAAIRMRVHRNQQVIELQPGDLLAMFTDGITEAEDASGEQFGDERLASLLREHKDEPLDEIVRIVTDRVRVWAHEPENADDTTILLARRI